MRCRDLDTGKTMPLSLADRFLPKGTNPIELHDLKEILATCVVTNLDTGERKRFDEALHSLERVWEPAKKGGEKERKKERKKRKKDRAGVIF